MNTNEDGKEIKVDINHLDNRKQSGRVYLYRCNITTLCREVVLLSDYNEPIKLEGKDAANIVLSSPNDASIVLLYQLTLVPKEKFSVNHIKLAPYCIVRNKTCEQFEYLPLMSTVVKFDSDDKNLRQDLYRTPSHAYGYIPSTHIAYLHNFFPEITIPVKTNYKEQVDQVMIVHYYQPNHDIVSVEVFLDKKINGTFSAAYCPSISGCRELIKFESNSETFNNPDLQSVKFQLKHNGKDIWLASVSIAPAASVNDETLQPVPTDLTHKFITECASDHFNINYYNSTFCDESVVSLSAKINEGALKCNCDLDGSVNSEECEKFGGQCECKENIIGRTCTRCKTGYFGFPNCKKCDCVIGNCDDITGECISPPYSHKNGTCFDDYYGYHVVMGCVECNCDLNGTEYQKTFCNKENGQCKCKENTDGLRCDVCKAGFFDYPDCEECTCNREGSIPQICDTETAECKCKENVYGERCDDCKYGTFNLEHRNPKGCTQCFCFGLVNQCRKSDLFFRSERDFDIDKWSLAYTKLSANQSSIDITIVNTDESDGLKLNIDENTNFKITESLYWSAPYKYTGNKVTSYGGSIRYKIRIKNSENIQPLIRPDLILVSSQNMTLVHTSLLQPLNDRVFENKVDLIESEFKHLLTGTSATREQLMIVLSSLNEVKLRAIYFSKIHTSELLDFEMDVAQKYDAQIASVPANSAEQCNCPPNFSGYSCESCEYGYYKVKSTGPGLFNCLPCNCSGHADTCDQETEECIDCRDNTYGKNCEFCKKGYYRVEYPNGQSECRMCPCPGPYDSNIFADSCLYEDNSKQVYYCQCNEGYTGQYCERCAPGYYGDPTRPGGKCLPCQCNNNIDTNDYDSCDQRTGACLKCLNNTSGLNCERCADWHYGDALSPQKCKACSCDKCGTQICDAKNGDCLCKNNVIGHNCGSCESDMWGFNNCNGCNKCDCDPVGSTSTQCDPITGQCKCKAGITSKTCNQCQSDHWNFGENGCQNCNCSKDGVQMSDTGGFKCNSTSGHCTCIPGVIGEKCDRCAPRWVLVKHVGCQSCDTCIHTILDDIEELFTKADSIESGNKDSSLTFKAQSKLTKLDKEFSFVKSIDPSQYDSTILANLQRTIKQAQKELVGLKLMTELDMNEKIKNYTALLNDAEIFNKDLNELRLKLDVLDQIITDLDREDITDFKNITDVQMGIYENIVDQISSRDFNLTIDRHLDFLKEYEQCMINHIYILIFYFNNFF
jgi:laminin alpha 3/5